MESNTETTMHVKLKNVLYSYCRGMEKTYLYHINKSGVFRLVTTLASTRCRIYLSIDDQLNYGLPNLNITFISFGIKSYLDRTCQVPYVMCMLVCVCKI